MVHTIVYYGVGPMEGIWVKVFKNGPSKICKRQFKNLKRYGLLMQTISLQIFLKAAFHKFYWVHSGIP